MQVTTHVVGLAGCQVRCPRGTTNIRTLGCQKVGRNQRFRMISVGSTESVQASDDQGEFENPI